MSNVYLVGFMGAGKTTVGEALAARLDWAFVDLDERLTERFGAPISAVFERQGEIAFRAAETDELTRAAAAPNVVVATGGGTFCDAANREIIHGSGGVSVFLDLPWLEIRRRLPGRNLDRPVFGSAEQARELFERRLPAYRRAMLTVSLSGDERGAEVADRIVEALEETPCAT
ncbi:MAG: shikimate kinase [Thermoanaerobaculales bacterium]